MGGHFKRGTTLDVDLSYTRSKSDADLNDAYGYFLSLTANPVVRPNAYGPTDRDSPNRFVGRARGSIGRNWILELAGEVRTGFPYSAVDERTRLRGRAEQSPVSDRRNRGRVGGAPVPVRAVRALDRAGLHQRPELVLSPGRPAEHRVAGVRLFLQFADPADPHHGAFPPLTRSVGTARPPV